MNLYNFKGFFLNENNDVFQRDLDVSAHSPKITIPSKGLNVDEGAHPGPLPNDEVLDEGEQAQLLQLQEQARISLLARELNKPEYSPDFDGIHCIDCDDELPLVRINHGFIRCVFCKELLENKQMR